jgi:hypothetical protein
MNLRIQELGAFILTCSFLTGCFVPVDESTDKQNLSASEFSSVSKLSSSSLAGSSALLSSSSFKEEQEIETSPIYVLGGSSHVDKGSYLDIDKGVVYGSYLLGIPDNAGAVDLQFAPNANAAEFFTPSASKHSEIQLYGDKSLKIATISDQALQFISTQDTTKPMMRWQLDSIWALSKSKASHVMSFVEGDLLIMKTNLGRTVIIEVLDADITYGTSSTTSIVIWK